MSNTIELWEVNKLIKKKFFIPTYQRGYRWDVQQRLTTILIILKYLNQGKPRKTYSIDYATREGSEKFLDEICDRAKDEIVEKNIDFYFMKTAFMTVEKWFETMTDDILKI